jgi:hypothetical protein
MTQLPFRKTILLLGLILALPCFIYAESQTWTLADGTTFEAELLNIFSTKAKFKNAQGEVQDVTLDRFSEESRIRIELANPPRLDLDIIKDIENRIFPMGINPNCQRPNEDRGYFGVRIIDKSSHAYNHELYLDLFVIGAELNRGRNFILLYRKSTSFFLTRENRRTLELRGDREVAIQKNHRFGEKYYGYIAIVKDTRGEIVAMRTTHDWLFECIETLSERYEGNFFDKSGARVFPTRPLFWRY